MGRAVSSCVPQECVLITTAPELKVGLVIAHPPALVLNVLGLDGGPPAAMGGQKDLVLVRLDA